MSEGREDRILIAQKNLPFWAQNHGRRTVESQTLWCVVIEEGVHKHLSWLIINQEKFDVLCMVVEEKVKELDE